MSGKYLSTRQVSLILPMLLISLILQSCSTAAKGPSTVPGSTVVEVQTQGGVYQGGQAAELRATFGSPVLYDLWISANNGSNIWSASVRLTADQVGSGTGQIAIGTGPISGGTGSVQKTGVVPRSADSGVLDFALASGKISGSASVTPNELGGLFTGDLVVSCWIPASQAPGGGTVMAGTISQPGDSEALVLDSDLSTPSCMPLRSWVRK